LLWCGAVAGPLFLGVALLEGATRPRYDAVRLPISLLSLGDRGWVQVLNFLVDGLLLLAFAVGLSRTRSVRGRGSTWGPRLVGLVGVGVLGAGVFVANPGDGYPPGTPQPVDATLHGALHDLCSLVVFAALPAACLVLARAFRAEGEPNWARSSALTGALTLGGAVLLLVGFSGATAIADVAGLLQRVWVALGWGWVTLLALHRLRAAPG